MKWLLFITKRLASAVVILLSLVLVVFLLQRFTPADPVRAALGAHASAASVAALQRQLGYNKPLFVQYFVYVGHVAQGNFGMSLRTRQPVLNDLLGYLPASVELMVGALFLAILIGAVMGISSAESWRGSGVFRFIMLGGASAPSFLLPLLGILLFFSRLGWLPAAGQTSILNAPTGPTHAVLVDSLLHGRFDVVRDAIGHLILPTVSLAIAPAVAIGRTLRSSLIEVTETAYIRTAKAKGMRRSAVIVRHALRNCMNGVLAMTGLQVGGMFGALAVVEEIFAWPGIGLYAQQSISSDDFPAVMGTTILVGAIYIAINAVVDILQAMADPRIVMQ